MERKNRNLLASILAFSLTVAAAPYLRCQPPQSGAGRPAPLHVVLEIKAGGTPMVIRGFTSVSGLESTTEVVEVREGGDPGVVRKIPGRTTWSPIVLKRGTIDPAQNELWNWRNNVIQGINDRRDGAVILMDRDGSELIRYPFFDAFPISWKGFSVNANGSDVAVEEIVLAVERIDRIQ